MPRQYKARTFMLCDGNYYPAERLPEFPDLHIIGELVYRSISSRDVSGLALYQDAYSVIDIPEYLPPCHGVAIGLLVEIPCTKCSRSTRWEPGKAAISAILEKAKHNGAFE